MVHEPAAAQRSPAGRRRHARTARRGPSTPCPRPGCRRLTLNAPLHRPLIPRSQRLITMPVCCVPRTARRRGNLWTASARVGAVLRYGQDGDVRRSGALFGAPARVLDRWHGCGRRQPQHWLTIAILWVFQSQSRRCGAPFRTTEVWTRDTSSSRAKPNRRARASGDSRPVHEGQRASRSRLTSRRWWLASCTACRTIQCGSTSVPSRTTVDAQAPDGYFPPKRDRHDRSPSTGPARNPMQVARRQPGSSEMAGFGDRDSEQLTPSWTERVPPDAYR